jgi:hypothetical protein
MEDGFDNVPNGPSSLPHENVPPIRRVPSADEWESKKLIIRSLYITKELSLEEVVDRMARDHNFSAT